jgi:tetratricopeptide (TPR) repeat protein
MDRLLHGIQRIFASPEGSQWQRAWRWFRRDHTPSATNALSSGVHAPRSGRDGAAEPETDPAIAAAARRAEAASDGYFAEPAFTQDELQFFDQLRDRYRLIQRLDRGGQGVVFEANQLHTQRRVAIKVLSGSLLPSRSQLERFEREVRIIAQLRHPNIVTIHDTGLLHGRPYIVMERIDGLPINDHVLLRRPTVREVVQLFVKVCRAVNVAHQNAVIHRDLKPANIMVGLEGEPTILDFGLAKSLTDVDPSDSTVSKCGHLLGTLPYLSPEQAAGDHQHVDIRSDVYSLGVVLYEMLVGAPPYPVRGNSDEVCANIRLREPAAPRRAALRMDPEDRAVTGTIADDLEKVVLRSLSKDPARRYQSAAEFAADLERFLNGEAVEAKADSKLYVAGKFVRRHRVAVAVAASFLLVLVAGLVATTLAWRHARWVAQVAEAGLQAGGYVRLGSFERDEGRVDKAIAMYERALEIAGRIDTDDRVLCRCIWDANQHLANLYIKQSKLDLADSCCSKNERLIAQFPQSGRDDEMLRMQGATIIQRSQLLTKQQRYDEALQAAQAAFVIQCELLKRHPTSESQRDDVAGGYERQAQILRKLGRRDESLDLFSKAHHEFQLLQHDHPADVDAMISLIRSLNWLAVWHMDLRTPRGDQDAKAYLMQAQQNLDDLIASGRRDARPAAIDEVRSVLDANLKILQRREELRQGYASTAVDDKDQ